MSEFRIHHDVNELLSLLRVRGGDGAEVYMDLLQKNRTPYVSTTVSAHSAKVSTGPGRAGQGTQGNTWSDGRMGRACEGTFRW